MTGILEKLRRLHNFDQEKRPGVFFSDAELAAVLCALHHGNEAREWKDQVATYAKRITEVIAERDLAQTQRDMAEIHRDEARDEKYAMRAERDAALEGLALNVEKCVSLVNERDAAREALKPFARNVGALSLGKALGHITREDLHRARAAYEKGGKP